MVNGKSRLAARFYDEEAPLASARAAIGRPLDADGAVALGLVTSAPDDLDWDEEIRLALEERASLSPDALTGMEANLRFGPGEALPPLARTIDDAGYHYPTVDVRVDRAARHATITVQAPAAGEPADAAATMRSTSGGSSLAPSASARSRCGGSESHLSCSSIEYISTFATWRQLSIAPVGHGAMHTLQLSHLPGLTT